MSHGTLNMTYLQIINESVTVLFEKAPSVFTSMRRNEAEMCRGASDPL